MNNLKIQTYRIAITLAARWLGLIGVISIQVSAQELGTESNPYLLNPSPVPTKNSVRIDSLDFSETGPLALPA